MAQSVADYEKAEEEREFLRAVVAGLAELEAGRSVSLAEAKARYGDKNGFDEWRKEVRDER